MKRLYTLAFLLFLFVQGLWGKHIIGGVLIYDCVGNGLYNFTLKMYRDCSDPTGAGFDFNAVISIYKGSAQVPLTTIFQSPDLIQDIEANVDDYPCLLLPPNICVEEGIYEFSYQFSDWPSAESYHISYQRCCRNNTITNIIGPGDTGATFTVEITPESQELCNDSPVYENFPPIVICSGEALNYDHSAVDAEGDQLIYELCAALAGGGVAGTPGNPGPANGCDGVVPNPACPPPYDPVNYFPPYNPLDPLGGTPPLSIDPITGVLTGTPVNQGQFVVGICVKEYRNGQLLSVIRREFQFNVASCEPVVDASLEADSLVADLGYVIRACNGDSQIAIENTSNFNPNIDSYYWLFQMDDTTVVQYDEIDPVIDFPGPGSYSGQFFINPGTICGDTASLFVEIFPNTEAFFEFSYDTCVAGPVFFTDASYTESGGLADWSWTFGVGGDTTSFQNPTHIFPSPGEYLVKLEVVDENGCEAVVFRQVPYFPIPALIVVSPNDTVSCPPATISFKNLSSPIDDSYQINWDFGDGGTGTDISPTHTYDTAGVYDVSLSIESPIGCVTDTVFQKLIEIKAGPVAGFEVTPPNPTNLSPEVFLEDLSINAAGWDYYVDGVRIGPGPDRAYTFQDTGLHVVQLIITHPQGCRDTLSRLVDVVPQITYFLPNAFTPNYDDSNDFFGGVGITRGMLDFRLVIWDRWGGVVFETDNPQEYWNGQFQNNGKPVLDGMYIYQVSYKGPRGEPFEEKGYVTLMR